MILGTGVDIVEIKRIKKAIKRWGNHFLTRIFHDEEIAYAKKNKNPIQHYAARFAAKEAVFKAVGNNPDIVWKDIKILNDKYGKPYCVLNKKKIKNKVFISISHSDHYAVASAIITS